VTATEVQRIVVVDDHPLYRDGIVSALSAIDGCEVVGTASDGAEAVRLVDEVAPDVVLMDVAMPGVNGVEATKQIVAAHPTVAVLMLTMLETDESVLAAVKAGARGYLLKGADRAEITAALRAVAAGQAVFGSGIADRMLGRLTEPPRSRANGSTAFPQLTDRELEVLTLLGQGLSNGAIARKLFLSDKTVRNHVSNVLMKLPAVNRDDAAEQARAANLA
jgi:DNA-binding NarL/FixJ family response regulator